MISKRSFNKKMSLVLILNLFLTSCSIFDKEIDKRAPSSIKIEKHISHSHSKLEKSLPDKDILYKYKGMLRLPPTRYVADKIIKIGLGLYLKQLPIKDEVRLRFKNALKSDQYKFTVVPFLMAIKSSFLASRKQRKNNFNEYILDIYPKGDEVIGLEHSHFHYEKKEKKKKSKEEKEQMKEMIAAVINIFDIVFLKDSEFVLGKMPKRNLKIITKVKDEIKKTLKIVRLSQDDDSLEAPVYDNLIKDDDRLEAMSVSLIDFLGIFTFHHYQMFASRYYYKEQAKKRMLLQFNKNFGEELWSDLNKELYHKKFGVQVIVDGLQGTLVEALVGGDSNHPLIKNVVYNHTNQDKFKPKKIPTYEAGPQEMSFIHAVSKNKQNLSNLNFLNFFKDLYKNHNKGIAKNGIATTPTISVRNLPLIQTGNAVIGKDGGTGLPNFHYLDRKKEQAFYFWGNDAIMLDDLTKKSGMKTLFERMPKKLTLNCMATYEAGANWSISPLLNVALGEKLRDFGEILCLDELTKRAKNEKKSRKLKTTLIKVGLKIKEDRYKNKEEKKRHKRRALRLITKIANLENEVMPSLVTFYSPWIDHMAHFTGPFSDEIISPTGELNRLDFWMGRLVDVYKDAGVYDNTLFSLTGDHGLTPTKFLIKADKAIFGTLKEEGIKLKMLKISSDEGEGPKIRNHIRKSAVRGYDVMTASTGGGNFQIELFKDQGKNWAQQPLYKDTLNLILQSGQAINVTKEIVNRLEETLEYGAIREEESNYKKSVTRLFAKHNDKRIDEIIHRDGNRVFYEFTVNLLGTDKLSKWTYKPTPKGLREYTALHKKCVEEATLEDKSSWCTEMQWRTLTSFTNKPDSVVQLSHLFDIDYSGTIHLFSNPYIGFNSLVPGRHAGEQFHEKDAFMAIWGTPVKLKNKIKSREITAPAATLYQFLTGKEVVKGEDGWANTSLIPFKK
jgi:hypothetical protein